MEGKVFNSKDQSLSKPCTRIFIHEARAFLLLRRLFILVQHPKKDVGFSLRLLFTLHRAGKDKTRPT